MHSSTVVLTIILQKNPIILLGLSLVSNEPFFIVFWLAGILMFVWRVNLHACLLVQRSLLLLACVRACVRACVLAAAATCLLLLLLLLLLACCCCRRRYVLLLLLMLQLLLLLLLLL
jgi:hypothetical protein